MIEYCHQRGEEDDGGENVKGEDGAQSDHVAGCRIKDFKPFAEGSAGDVLGDVGAAEIEVAENEVGALIGEAEDVRNERACPFEYNSARTGAQDQQGEYDLQPDSHPDRPPVDRPTVG
ncbi:hypothetical protein BMS3Bbin04_01994 [bacterium BMS3Bbin04]|nr:hypothetical protein BMS3Bbin04_01994 [bacterium BMS3Bbin04]